MSTIEEVGDKIRSAIREARSEGLDIKPQSLRQDNRCCAIGAVIRNDPSVKYMGAAEILGTGFAEVIAVARGFDGSVNNGGPFPEWYDLGKQIRKEVQTGVL